MFLYLDEKGVFVSENHYFIDLIQNLQYDAIYHEHLRYYSLTSLSYLFELHDLEIFHAVKIPTHGGSIRVYACRRGLLKPTENIQQLINDEPTGRKLSIALSQFKNRVYDSKMSILSELFKIKAKKNTIVGIGAPSRATTLINFLGIDESTLSFICEIKGSLKIGNYLPGTKIRIVDEEELFLAKVDYALLLSWHISDELITNLKNKGFNGKFIIHCPI